MDDSERKQKPRRATKSTVKEAAKQQRSYVEREDGQDGLDSSPSRTRAPEVAWIQMTLSTTQGMDSSEDRVRLLMKETIEFLRSHAFIFNFSNIKMVKDKILDQVPSGTFRGIIFGLYQSCDAFVSEDACMKISS